MAKIKMVATKPHSWGMRTVEADEEFEVDNEAQAQTLISLGRATLKDKKSTKVKPTGTRADPEPEEDEVEEENGEEEEETATEATPARRRYQTRRLKPKV